MLMTAPLWLERGHLISHSIEMLAHESAYLICRVAGLRYITEWVFQIGKPGVGSCCCMPLIYTFGRHLGSLSWLVYHRQLPYRYRSRGSTSLCHPSIDAPQPYLLSILPNGLFIEDDEAF